MRSAPLVLLGLLTACDPASVDPARVDPARVDPCSAPRGDVQGIVTDGLDGAALSGVRVRSRACPAEALSDSRGELTLRLPAGDYDLWLDRADYIEGQRAHVTVEAGASVAIDLHLFPIDPSDAAIDAYFARQPVRRHAHPAHERPRVSPTVADDEVGAARQGLDESMLPSVIRVWRAGGTAIEPSAANGFADRSCDPTAVVDVLPREDYVKGVIPHEWIPSWHPEALRAGAIAARSYAVNWWARGGRWDCADVDDGTVTQVYRDDRSATTNEAVDATAGQVIMMGGSIVSAEYSAENSDPTATGVAEPTCTGTTRNGHGRGMCQWGTHRWASAICANAPCDFSAFGGATPRDYTWIVQHYFPSATLESCGTPAAPCGSIPAGGGIVDDTDLCFTAFGPAMYWRTEAAGWQDQLRWTNAFEASSPSNWARWTLHFDAPGTYRVETYVDPAWGVYSETRYTITHAGGDSEVTIDQGMTDGWVMLGTFDFGAAGAVAVVDDVPGPVPSDQRIVADAVRLTPMGGSADAGTRTDAGATDGGSSTFDAGREGPGRGSAGCGCRMASGSIALGPWLAIVGGVLFGARRRRR